MSSISPGNVVFAWLALPGATVTLSISRSPAIW
jgi:hypothetical protein